LLESSLPVICGERDETISYLFFSAQGNLLNMEYM